MYLEFDFLGGSPSADKLLMIVDLDTLGSEIGVPSFEMVDAVLGERRGPELVRRSNS